MESSDSRTEALALAHGALWAAGGLARLLWPAGRRADSRRWLGRIIGALMSAAGATLLLAGARRRVSGEIVFFAASSSLALAASHAAYASVRRLRPVFLLDTGLESVLAIGWLSSAVAREVERRRAEERRRALGVRESHGAWDIAVGETVQPGGGRDLVAESSMESFPASDAPAIGQED